MKNMIVHGENAILEVESRFVELFPYLHLEFYLRGVSVPSERGYLNLKSIAKKKQLETFSILPAMSVHQLENAFWDNMGIQISVFRKVGNSMLETSFTSSWTLEHQNRKGSELQKAFVIK